MKFVATALLAPIALFVVACGSGSGPASNSPATSCAAPKVIVPDPPKLDAATTKSLEDALSSLVSVNGKPGPMYQQGWARIDAASAPQEIEFILSHFDDDRPTELLESLEMPDGGPVPYGIGDALFHVFRCRFASNDHYFDKREEPPFLHSKEALRAWGKACAYDIELMHRQYDAEKPKYHR